MTIKMVLMTIRYPCDMCRYSPTRTEYLKRIKRYEALMLPMAILSKGKRRFSNLYKEGIIVKGLHVTNLNIQLS